jgi:hypothetical protein
MRIEERRALLDGFRIYHPPVLVDTLEGLRTGWLLDTHNAHMALVEALAHAVSPGGVLDPEEPPACRLCSAAKGWARGER